MHPQTFRSCEYKRKSLSHMKSILRYCFVIIWKNRNLSDGPYWIPRSCKNCKSCRWIQKSWYDGRLHFNFDLTLSRKRYMTLFFNFSSVLLFSSFLSNYRNIFSFSETGHGWVQNGSDLYELCRRERSSDLNDIDFQVEECYFAIKHSTVKKYLSFFLHCEFLLIFVTFAKLWQNEIFLFFYK